MTRTAPETICLLRLSAIGDTCNLLPVVRTLRKVWPQTTVTWIIGRTEHQLLGAVDDIEFITFDKRAGGAARRELRTLLKNRRFDVLLHMHASMRANLVSRCIPATRRIGFDRKRARDFQWLFCNEHIDALPACHVLDGFFQFIEKLGIAERHLTWDIPIAGQDMAFAADILRTPTMLISPCSSQRWRNFRNWRAENYAQIAAVARQEHGLATVLTGGSTEVDMASGQDIERLADVPVTNLIGKTSLPQLLALISQARLLVSPDSGPAHMATTVGTPVVGLYATSNRWRTGPYLSQEWVVDRYPDAVSRALGKSVADLPWGYRVRTPYAMDLISIDDVREKLNAIMRSSGH